jgi:predicted nucleic acid-binding protein
MAAKKSKYKTCIRNLLRELNENKIRIYTSIITVQEMAVATYRAGALAKDVYGDINKIARIYNVTKEITLTAAKNEAELKDMAQRELEKRDPKKPETEEQKLERICQNRRRKWDCFHIATAQAIGCVELYSTDKDFAKRPDQLGIRSFKVLDPCEAPKTIEGPLFQKPGPIQK